MVIGSWVALFPGTLENWLGGSYVWTDNWSISRAEFETFTLGTLAVFMVVALVGYAMGADTRRASLSLNLETDLPVYSAMEADPSALAGD
jgi:hypothetical protein